MTRPIAIFGLLAIATTVVAEDFFLTDPTGKKFGPYEFKQGAKVPIAGKEFTITKVVTSKQQVTEKLRSIVIPVIDFRNANVADVIEYLHNISAEHDPQTTPPRGITCIFRMGPDGGSPGKSAATLPTVTLSSRNMSMLDAINAICKMCGLYWFVQDASVVIEPIVQSQ